MSSIVGARSGGGAAWARIGGIHPSAIASLGPERSAKAPAQAASKPSSKAKRATKPQTEDFKAVAPKTAKP